MQEEEFKEILKEVIGIMLDEMDKMQKQIEVLNERQNRIDNQELQTNVPVEDGKQIHIPGL